ncbi:GGDEF domain-containing protein [Paenibacillus sp. LHD-38]|uniref:GGDEF domain-containing protein n=1 Tax=Paenibacillus sp. LHD-38 TaxID=3072143 RepID=UPI00280D326B|nr:GGDEF domain-containing protein [Paenibacillus sp. LHD-38]MDQ8738192.1 GGDEF domain-containing protein [Paenibacillus sp. LHD-38]
MSNLLIQVYADIGMVGRVGGEEFAVFLKGRSEDDSLELAERLRKMLEQTEISLSEGKQISVTTSGGIAFVDRNGLTFEELFQLADKALYTSKDSGKNQITKA